MLGKARILIVDDEESVLGLMGTVLRMAGHSVSTALEAQEALTQCRHAGWTPDLLITDVLLHPAYTGCELARSARIIHPALPVLYVSGLADSDLVAEEVGQGLAAFLAKPFSPRALTDRVVLALGLRNLALS